MKLIDKDALVAEIERRKETWQHQDQQYIAGGRDVCDYLLGFLDTPEVKEVNLEEEINRWQGCEAFPEGVNITPLPKAMDIVERTAKHFFELGLNAKQ